MRFEKYSGLNSKVWELFNSIQTLNGAWELFRSARIDVVKWPTDEEARLFAEKAIAASKSETKCKQALDFAASAGVRQQRVAAEAVELMPMQQLA